MNNILNGFSPSNKVYGSGDYKIARIKSYGDVHSTNIDATGYTNHCAKDFFICKDTTNEKISVYQQIFSTPTFYFGTVMVPYGKQAIIDYTNAGFSEYPKIYLTPVTTVSGTIARVQYGTVSERQAGIIVETTYTGETPVNYIAVGTRVKPF